MHSKSVFKLLKLSLSFCLLVLFNQALIASVISTKPVATKIQFYSASLDLQYDPSMLSKNKHCTSTPCIKRFYTKLDETNYSVLLDQLLAYKEELQLNDWFFFKLVRKAVDKIYADQRDMHRTSVTWFLLTKAGYNTRLFTARSKYTFLYVQTEETVFEVPFIKLKDKRFVNLTAIHYGVDTRQIVFEMPKFQPGAISTQAFSFRIDQMPMLPPKTVEKTLVFTKDDERFNLKIAVDTLGSELLKSFPITKPINYIQVPMSAVTMESLKKELTPLLEGKSDEEKISLFLSLTRKAFPYKNDQVRFRRDLPLTADQLMLADSSDHEDRCALLYNLLTEFTDLNFIVVQYVHDDIVTIGVDLPEVVGKPFEHDGVVYTICDPTIPKNSSRLGIYPINLDKDIEILDVVKQGD